MTKNICTVLILFFSSFVFGQKFEKSTYDSLIGHSKYDRELRIRTEISVSNDYKMTRIYQDSSDNWVLEKHLSNSESVTNNLGKEFYKSWLELLTTNILDLPNLEEIQYKLGTKKVIQENGQYEMIEEVVIGPNDGIHYIIEMKDQNKFNRLEISNPYFYITKFPNVDEFKYLDRFLKLFKEIQKNN